METRKHAPLAALAVALMLALSPLGALAEKGGKHNKDKGNNGHDSRDNGGSSVSVEFRFGDSDRRAVQEYYQSPARGKGCPPGLAKKNNGCMPPGQAKKWRVGQRLPAGVVYYPVPQPVVVQLGLPPAGYRYVRVANDILLMAIGTRMVVDAITDLGRIL